MPDSVYSEARRSLAKSLSGLFIKSNVKQMCAFRVHLWIEKIQKESPLMGM